MTANQIAYQAMRETQRANMAREAETERANKAREGETYRANVASEDIARANLAQRAFEYADMAPYTKAEKVAKTAESAAKAAKTIKDTFNPFS